MRLSCVCSPAWNIGSGAVRRRHGLPVAPGPICHDRAGRPQVRSEHTQRRSLRRDQADRQPAETGPARELPAADRALRLAGRDRRGGVFRGTTAGGEASSGGRPPGRYRTMRIFAGERLAYRVIYQDKSPLHQLNSITREDYTNLRFADFIQWVNVSRRDGLMTFDGDPSMLDALDLKPAGQWDRISLSSTVVPPDVLFYDGTRFGVPAMIMIRISAAGLPWGRARSGSAFPATE